MTSETGETHLTGWYQYPPRTGNRRKPARRGPRIPVPACRALGVAPSQQVSIYDNPDHEPLITCRECLDWLGDGDNRLIVTKDGMDEWIRRRVTSGDVDIHYVDIPSGNTGILTPDDL